MTDLPVHPLCDMFPLMDADQFSRFVEDIREHQLIRPIIVHEGQLVDGRNRLRACQQLNLTPLFTQWRDEYTGQMSLEQWIWSTNIERRNLTPDQLAAAIVGRNNYERMRASNGRFVRHHQDPGDGIDQQHLTRSRLAKEAGVSQHRIERARAIQLVDPGLLKEVARGTITAAEALSRVKAAPSAIQPAAQSPAEDDEPRVWQGVDRESKDRMIRVLSRVHGLCRGFDTLSIPALHRSCDAKEIKEWANMARSAARVLRGFAADLLEEQRETHQ